MTTDNLAFVPDPTEGAADVALVDRLTDLARDLDRRLVELTMLDQLTAEIEAGFSVETVLDGLFRRFDTLVPYDRIGFALIDEDGRTVTARWARSRLGEVQLPVGYSAELEGSSLAELLRRNQPRIIADLEAYLRTHPESDSTRRMVAEGIRSSLTCPLVVDGRPVGFLFFSSAQAHTYRTEHVTLLTRIAQRLSVIVEKAILVAELERQRSELAHRNRQLEDANRLKDRFISMAAHDIRNPVGNILMLAQYLRASGAEDGDDLLADIEGEATAVLQLVNDLLSVALLQAGRLVLEPSPFDLADLITEVAARHARLAEAKDTAVEAEVGGPVTVFADRRRLQQVLDNLLSNAVKFSPPWSEVTLRLAAGDRARIEVDDQGPGLTATDRERLFTEFGRLSATPTGGEPSSGLGLAIARRITEAHGGSIGADDLPDGSRFWVELPMQEA